MRRRIVTQDREGEKWGSVSQGKGIGEKDKVRKKGRHKITEGDRIGGRDREGRTERERGWAERREGEEETKRETGGRQRTSRHLELRQVNGCFSSSESSPYHPPVDAGLGESEIPGWMQERGMEDSFILKFCYLNLLLGSSREEAAPPYWPGFQPSSFRELLWRRVPLCWDWLLMSVFSSLIDQGPNHCP